MATHPHYIAFEGGDGAGKGKQVSLIEETYKSRDDVVFVREPGSTDLGEALRELILHRPMTIFTETCLFLGARDQLWTNVIYPALKAGKYVISDRCGLSTIAYQVYGKQSPQLLDFIRNSHRLIYGEWEPVCLLFDLPLDVSKQRRQNRGGPEDQFERQPDDFHDRVRQGYLTHVRDFATHFVLDGSQSIDVLKAEVARILAPLGL